MWKLLCGDSAVERYLGYLTVAAIDLLTGKSEVEERTKMKAFDRNYKRLDEVVCAINDLQNEFDENDSEIETVTRDCIGETVGYILEWFGIPIGTEEAIRERDW